MRGGAPQADAFRQDPVAKGAKGPPPGRRFQIDQIIAAIFEADVGKPHEPAVGEIAGGEIVGDQRQALAGERGFDGEHGGQRSAHGGYMDIDEPRFLEPPTPKRAIVLMQQFVVADPGRLKNSRNFPV